MNSTEVQSILIEILRSNLNGDDISMPIKEKLTPAVLASVSLLAKKQDLAHVVSKAVYNNGINAPAELVEKLKREEMLSVYRCEHQRYALEEICKVFDEIKITHIPLKGSVIRPFYPYENMRTSCDIDILIREEDVSSAVSKLENIGYRLEGRNYHDVSLFSPNRVHLELHFSINENMDNLDAVLENVWEYTEQVQGSRCGLKKEFFVFQIYAHMAYHFICGGCGIKSLMDIWILKHKMDAPFTLAKDLLEKAGIYKFAEEMSILADKCFGGDDRDEFSNRILDYVFSGGAYGSVQNRMTVQKNRSQNSVAYTIDRLFPPYKYMSALYPVLKKAPILLPVCWVARWIKALFDGKLNRLAADITHFDGVSENEAADILELHSKLGL